MARGRKRYKREKGDVVLSFKVSVDVKGRLEKIVQSFDNGIGDVFLGDVAESILLAFFRGNPPPKDLEKGRELVIMKRKGVL